MVWKGFTSGGKFIFEPDNKATKTTYTFPAPSTGECYGNTIVGDPIDGNSGEIAAALGASILRSTLAFYTGFPVPQTDRNLYYTKPPFFDHASHIFSRKATFTSPSINLPCCKLLAISVNAVLTSDFFTCVSKLRRAGCVRG